MSMVKIVDPGSYDFGAPVSRLVKVAAGGLRGNDLRDFIKVASHEFVDVLRNWTPDSGEVPIHLIAIGAAEMYGNNRNGDSFRRQPCREQHHTFVKHARFYRNHLNRDPHKSYGYIKASAYNEDMDRIELLVSLFGTKEAADRHQALVADKEMEKLARDEELATSMASLVPHDLCCKAGSYIETRAGLKTIETVNTGDMVKTAAGQWNRVSQTFQRAHSGTVVELDIVGAVDTLVVTAKHPVLLARSEQFRSCRGTVERRKRRHTFRNGNTCATCSTQVVPKTIWSNADTIRVDDYLVYPVRTPGTVAVAPELAYLVGQYVGNGSLFGEKRGRKHDGPFRTYGISLTTSHAWPEILQQILATAELVHGRKQPVYESGCERKSWQVHIYSRRLAAVCYRGVGEYSLHKRLADWIFDWDTEARLHFLGGVLDTDGSIDNNAQAGIGRINFCNRTLAYQIQRLFWGLGYFASYHEEAVDDTSWAANTDYMSVVGLSAGVVRHLRPYSIKAKKLASDRKFSCSQCFVLDGKMFLRVRSVVQRHDELDVYNLRVENEENYAANGIIVHNCSSCGNKARTRAEYCLGVDEGGQCKHGGLKHNIGRLCDDGHQLHADNPINRWFDDSHVTRPADRIAYALGKAAESELVVAAPVLELEEVPARVLYGAGLISSTLQKQSEWIAASPTQLEAGELLSSTLVDPVVCPPHTKLSHALRALADENIVLPVPEFLRLIGAAKREEDLVKLSACAAAATIDTEALASELLSTPAVYQPRGEPAAPAVRQWAHKLAESYGRDPRWAERRAWKFALHRDEDLVGADAERDRPFRKFACVEINAYAKYSELGQELAGHYRRYRAAAEIFANRACVVAGPG